VTVKVYCDKCANVISNDNLNIPAHNIGVDGVQWQCCDPCFTECRYGTLLPGADNVTKKEDTPT
jgi:hypothetical protein